MKKAVFFDRDGTLIKSVHYLNSPDQVELIDGAARVLTELERAGYLRIIVTNQAAIGKGLLSLEGLELIQDRLAALLKENDSSVDGWYFCPETRVSNDNETIDHVDRKPGPGMLLQAASDFDISLSDSWMVGDMLSDAVAGKNAGCKGSILIESRFSGTALESNPSVDYLVLNLDQAAQIIMDKKI